MKRLVPVALNSDAYSRSARFGVAVVCSWSSQYVELLAPVFSEKYAAEVFCAVHPQVIPGNSDGEIALAREIAEFQARFDQAHDGIVYPTPDGRYPTAAVLAGWYVEFRQTGKEDCLHAAASR